MKYVTTVGEANFAIEVLDNCISAFCNYNGLKLLHATCDDMFRILFHYVFSVVHLCSASLGIG